MKQLAYRTTVAAKELGVSSHHIRRLIETGQLDAEATRGGHYRIPVEEVERLKRDGVPPFPQTAPGDEEPDDAPATEPKVLTYTPIPEAPEVQEERDALAIVETRVKRRRVELEGERIEDEFREREARRQQEIRETLRLQARQAEEERRREWEERTVDYALRRTPSECPADMRIRVAQAVRNAIKILGPSTSQEVVHRTADAAAWDALAEFRHRQDREAAIKAAVDSPSYWGVPSDKADLLRIKAKHLATEAIREQGNGMSAQELRRIAEAAVEPVAAECDNHRAKEKLVSEMTFWRFMEASGDERQRATDAVREGLERAPVTDSLSKLRARVERVLRPYDEEVDERLLADKSENEVLELIGRAERFLDQILRDEYEWESVFERWEAEREMRKPLAKAVREAFEEDEVCEASLEHFVVNWVSERIEAD